MYAPDFDGEIMKRNRTTLYIRLVDDIFNQTKCLLMNTFIRLLMLYGTYRLILRMEEAETIGLVTLTILSRTKVLNTRMSVHRSYSWWLDRRRRSGKTLTEAIKSTRKCYEPGVRTRCIYGEVWVEICTTRWLVWNTGLQTIKTRSSAITEIVRDASVGAHSLISL